MSGKKAASTCQVKKLEDLPTDILLVILNHLLPSEFAARVRALRPIARLNHRFHALASHPHIFHNAHINLWEIWCKTYSPAVYEAYTRAVEKYARNVTDLDLNDRRFSIKLKRRILEAVEGAARVNIQAPTFEELKTLLQVRKDGDEHGVPGDDHGMWIPCPRGCKSLAIRLEKDSVQLASSVPWFYEIGHQLQELRLWQFMIIPEFDCPNLTLLSLQKVPAFTLDNFWPRFGLHFPNVTNLELELDKPVEEALLSFRSLKKLYLDGAERFQVGRISVMMETLSKLRLFQWGTADDQEIGGDEFWHLLKAMPNLQLLSLMSTRIGPSTRTSMFPTLSKLKSLQLQVSPVDQATFAELLKGAPNLEVLFFDLSRIDIAGDLILLPVHMPIRDVYWNMDELDWLEAKPWLLLNLPRILSGVRELHIYYPQLDIIDPPFLAHCEHLEELRVDYDEPVVDESMQYLLPGKSTVLPNVKTLFVGLLGDGAMHSKRWLEERWREACPRLECLEMKEVVRW